MSQTPDPKDPKALLTPEDVACAADCNEKWQACQTEKPEDKGSCHTQLAKCVKSCDSEKK